MNIIKKSVIRDLKNNLTRWTEIVDKNQSKIRELQCENKTLLSQMKDTRDLLKELGVEE